MMTLGAQSVTTGTARDAGESKKSDGPRTRLCCFYRFRQEKAKVLHHLSTSGVLQSPCLFSRLLFRQAAANLAQHPGNALASAASHLCQLHDCRDPGLQGYYMATWKEANTWTQLSARLSHNTGLFLCQYIQPPSSLRRCTQLDVV